MKTKIAIALLAALPMLAMAGEYTTPGSYGVIKGKRVTATAVVSSLIEEVYTTPASGQFFITQFCKTSSSAVHSLYLEALNFTTSWQSHLAVLPPGQNCVTFPEPIAVPKGTTLRCWADDVQACAVFGILSK